MRSDAAVIWSALSAIIFKREWSSAYSTIKECLTTIGSWQIYKLNKGGDQIAS